jgi:large subunit ribosomal protein L17
MRHRVEGRKLKRTASHRKALLQALATSLFRHKRIRTTEAKAKEARRFAEAIITRAKRAHVAEAAGGAVDVHARREVARHIHDNTVLRELFSEIAPKVATREGGYTRVVKLGQRLGDGARIAILELVDYNIERDENASRSRSKSAISRAERVARSRAKQAEKEAKPAPAAAAPVEAAPVAEPIAEAPVEPIEDAAPETPAEGNEEGSTEKNPA